ncbi:MAG: winged helix-turn-helix domain-containing protein [Nitrososphaeraceae archaeon]
MKKNRSRYEIVNEILKVVLSMSKLSSSFFNCKKTHIAFHADLTYPQLCDYLGQLIGVELLKIVRYGPYQYYEITPKGRRYLQIFEELQNAIDLSRKVVAITSTND